MTRVLVTGGLGVLGREVVRRLADQGYTVRVMSRRSRPADLAPTLEWAQVDLEDGAVIAGKFRAPTSLCMALRCPSAKPNRLTSTGPNGCSRRPSPLGVQHVIYVSIVGIDRIPYGYYRHMASEALVQVGAYPSQFRATQFHTF